MSPFDDIQRLEIRKNQYQNLVQMLERLLDFRRWGFQQTYTHINPSLPIIVIYDSELCRVKFALGGGDRYGGDEMSINYGRLHASNDQDFISWNGEDCWCWHHVHDVLRFLDGLSPQEAVDQLRVKHQWPEVAEKFRQSEIGKKLSRQNHPEWITRMHTAIWEHYGQRLFELFDLPRSDLWEQYVRFVREYRKIMALPSSFPGYTAPPRDRIC